MRILRSIGGLILILAGLFCALIVYQSSGGEDGWREFRVERMIRKNLIFAIGTPLALCLGVAVAHTGSRRNFWFGVILVFLALALAIAGGGSLDIRDGAPWLIAAGILAIASAVIPALGRKPA